MGKIIAWHGEPSLKAAALERLREHRRLDEIIQHLGCLTHHKAAERLFGIEHRVGYWLEAVFEGLPKSERAAWVLESCEAIPVGADLSQCHHELAVWLLGPDSPSAHGNQHPLVRDAVAAVRVLHEQRVSADDPRWYAAGYAARSIAESAARSAGYAAESAAEYARYARYARYAAWSAAESAAGSAWSAAGSASGSAGYAAESAVRSAVKSAWSARYAAWSAGEYVARPAAEHVAEYVARPARYAAWSSIAAKSLEIFRTAPIVTDCTLTPEIEQDLCCRQLWCRDESYSSG